MKSTGIVRKIDDLGRIVVPKELRDVLNIAIKDPVEIFMSGETVILKKYNPGCVFCGEVEGVTDFKGKKICNKCRKRLK